MSEFNKPWDHEDWRRTENRWAAGCRWLQSWWRDQVLGLSAGPRSGSTSDLVCSMLPLDAKPDANFLDARIAAAVDARLDEGDHSGIINRDRLRRNLLSSQPACFNLFGPFVERPNDLLGWVQSLDATAVWVDGVRFEWAPPRAEHFDGGSAFDAFVTFTTEAGGRRFVGIECKYAEDLSRSSITVRPTYCDFTASCSWWRDGAAVRLQAARLRQLWLNTLLAQSLVSRGGGVFEAGLVAVVALRADQSAERATAEVRSELTEPDRWLRWAPYESVLEQVIGHDGWKAAFSRRYIDFAPVVHLLAENDQRRT